MAVGTALSQVQTALYTKLTGDATLTSLVTGVFDVAAVPENQAFPYVTIGDSVEAQDDTLDYRTYDGSYTLHIWTQSGGFRPGGFKQAQTILARLNLLLHRQTLSLSSQTHVGTWLLSAQQIVDEDGITQHIVPRYRVVAQETL